MAAKIVAALAVLCVVMLYLLYTARRLDRLHRRVDAAGAALDAQLQRRSAVAAAFATNVPLPPSSAIAVATCASEASILRGLGHDREVAENALSRALMDIAAVAPAVFSEPVPVTVEMHDEGLRATFARRFYNDAVRDALVVRDRPTVRWLRLAGSAPHPTYFEMDDDELPSPRIPVAAQP